MDFQIKKEIKLPDHVFDARFHPNVAKDFVAASTIGGDVFFIESGVVKKKLKKHHKGSSIRKVRFNDQGHMITIARTVKVYDFDSNQTLHTLKRNDENKANFYSVMPLSNNIISAGDDDGSVFVWDVRLPPQEPIFTSSDCEQYISDIDAKFESRKLMVCTSGEGTLTAYDLRSKKMIDPQSELFEAGFQCVKLVDLNKKVVVGGEDGAIYVFNHNEWAHTIGKFAVSDDVHNRGKSSIDCLELIPDTSSFAAGCSDGKVRLFTLWPHQTLGEKILCKRSSIESIHAKPGEKQFVVCGENYINIFDLLEKDSEQSSEDDDDDDDTSDDTNSAPASSAQAESERDGASGTSSSSDHDNETKPAAKKFKNINDDYLNLFD